MKEETGITNVSVEKLYRVKGTFTCRVSDGSLNYEITAGEFSLIFMENL